MARRTSEITLSPAVLKWARETAGYSLDEVAEHFRIPGDRVVSWESVEPARMTLHKLEDLARYYKRPTAALLLREPPPAALVPHDFRRSAQRRAPFSPELRLAVRRAYRLQRFAREMLEAMGQDFESDVSRANPEDSPEDVARGQRSSFGVTVAKQLEWKSAGEAFRRWRDAIESRIVPVFQGDFRRLEAQGFSLTTALPYTIVVSVKDSFTARSFTLFHEFAHLLLRQGGICQTEEALPPNGANATRVEEWCDRFAEAFLIDGDTLREKLETELFLHRAAGYEQALRHLANAFSVSQQVVLFRFWHLGLLEESRFWSEYRRVAEEAAAIAAMRGKKTEGKGGPPPAEKAVQERGPLFARAVLDALDREILSGVDAIDFLGVKLKHLDKVRQAAHR